MLDRAPVADRENDLAALRGNPSFVWRFGQNRRLEMIKRWMPSRTGRILVDGCGVGSYVIHLLPFAEQVWGLDIEAQRVADTKQRVAKAGFAVAGPQSPLEMRCAVLQVAAGEHLPYASSSFDLVLSHEVIEHVQDDYATLAEIVRVLRPGGRLVLFCPNRLYPFETHGHYWRGTYHFGNTPLINYLPDPLRNRLAPHVRAYTSRALQALLYHQPVRILAHTQIFPGYDNIAARRPHLGRLLRAVTYTLERSPLHRFGLSHFLVLEKQ